MSPSNPGITWMTSASALIPITFAVTLLTAHEPSNVFAIFYLLFRFCGLSLTLFSPCYLQIVLLISLLICCCNCRISVAWLSNFHDHVYRYVWTVCWGLNLADAGSLAAYSNLTFELMATSWWGCIWVDTQWIACPLAIVLFLYL